MSLKRRDFIRALAGAVATSALSPPAARAQQSAIPVVGLLNSSTFEGYVEEFVAFRRGLAEAGYIEGRNVAFAYRAAENQFDRLPALADDLVRRRVAAIFTAGNAPPALAAKAATQVIPTVFMMGADPVEIGVVSSLARPNGNITGVTVLAGELVPKRLALLHELVPAAATIAYLVNLTNPAFSEASLKEQTEAARGLGVQLVVLDASTPTGIDHAFATPVEQRAGALLVGADASLIAQRDKLVALAARHAIPASYSRFDAVEIGGLTSYAANIGDAFRQAGRYMARILNGEKAGDLPIQQSTRFELAINLKTARALGLTISATLLALADRVIE